MRNYKKLAESIENRINPEKIAFRKSFSDELSSISYNDVLKFVRMAMKGVEPEYTQRTRDAGERVKRHLDEALTDKEFRYQGSFMTNTHIKGYSDIDLLVISNKFNYWDSNSVDEILNSYTKKNEYSSYSIQKLEAEKRTPRYLGNAEEDLLKLRLDSETKLLEVYAICDITKPIAIKIKNLSLNREVDVVIANWYDDVRSIINDKNENRGIQVYNKKTNEREKVDYPFLSIKRINEKSSLTKGHLKKMIRFLKNIKAHSELDIDLNSFDINAICYAIEKYKYENRSYIELVKVIYDQLFRICNDYEYANNLKSVDEKEYIFKNKQGKITNLKLIMNEVQSVLADLKTEVIYG